MKAYLPSFFKFTQASDLIRLGKHNDGGYLVSLADIKQSNLLIGFGICDDWSFEADFVKLNDVEVFAYDASVNFKFWLKRIIIETIKNPFSFRGLKKLLSYNNFFKGKRKHIKKFVGLNTSNNNHITFLDSINETNSENIFLKIDVEGSEYRFLNDIIKYEDRITGMVIEFHDCDIHIERIENFIKKFKLNLVHIQANNFAPIRSDDGLPLILELTFSKYSNLMNSYKLPHKLDMPNNKNFSEYELKINC